MTHAKSKLNQYPVQAGTRAEYTASLSTSETGPVISQPELAEGPGGGCTVGGIDGVPAKGRASD